MRGLDCATMHIIVKLVRIMPPPLRLVYIPQVLHWMSAAVIIPGIAGFSPSFLPRNFPFLSLASIKSPIAAGTRGSSSSLKHFWSLPRDDVHPAKTKEHAPYDTNDTNYTNGPTNSLPLLQRIDKLFLFDRFDELVLPTISTMNVTDILLKIDLDHERDVSWAEASPLPFER